MSVHRGPVVLPKLSTNIQSTKSPLQYGNDGHLSSASSRDSSFLMTPTSSANSHSGHYATAHHDYAHYLTYGPTHNQERALTHSPEVVGWSRNPTPFVKRYIDDPSAGKIIQPNASRSVITRNANSVNPAPPRGLGSEQDRNVQPEPSSSIPFPRTQSLNSNGCSTPGLSRYPTISSGVSMVEHRPKLGPHHFLVSRQVAKGGFGRVYEGTELQSGNVVAIKTVQRKGLARHRVDAVLKEQAISRRVSQDRHTCEDGSEFVVRMISSFLTPSHFVFVLEYHGAGDLRDVDFPLRTEDARFYIGEMALGLRYLHSQNIVLRDLKPANALLGFDGHVRLADFGLATMLESRKQPKDKGIPERERSSSVLSFTTRARSGSLRSMADTLGLPKLSFGAGKKGSETPERPRTGGANLGRSKSWGLGNAKMHRYQQRTVLCGTPGYISPEGYQGRHGSEGDIWALGITLYEFITGVNPFDTWGEPTKEIKTKVLSGEPFYPETMPEDTKSILEKLLQKKWKKRATLDEMMAHPFFQADKKFWDRLQKKQLRPPALPDAARERLRRVSEFPQSNERSEMPLILHLEQESMNMPSDSSREELSDDETEAFYMDEIESLSRSPRR